MQEITTILPRYRELNQTYSTILGRGVRFDELCFISDFYNQFSDKQAFETMIINLMLELNSEQYSVLLRSLLGEIETNISLYRKNQPFWDSVDIKSVCQNFADQYNLGIKHQHQIVQEYSDELNRINGSLESIGFRQHTKEEENGLWKKYEYQTSLYQREQKELSDLYERQKEAQREATRYSTNNFGVIVELSSSLLAILNKYIPVKEEQPQPTTTPIAQGAIYFDMGLISAIHKECNNDQFEDTSEWDLYAILNNRPTETKLKVKSGEKIRVCYLIYRLYEHLKRADKAQWRSDILKRLDITEGYYAAKYKEPVSELPSQKSKKFAQDMEGIFN